MQLNGSGAIVTGGASGLGRGTAAVLAAAGADVVILDLPGSPGEQTARELSEGSAGSVRFAPADVTDEASVQAAIDLVQERTPLRVAVSCAGIATAGRTVGRDGPLALDAFERTIRINLIGTFNVARLAAAAMAANDPITVQSLPGVPETAERGVIVNTASVAAFDGQIGQAAYSASKGGVAAMTLPLARDLSKLLVRVVTIAPGIMQTPMMAGMPADVQASLEEQIPHPSRMGTPAEYAALVRHVVENPLLNGETIRLDGAIRMQPK
ncbi:NAD(P)-dependent dehydrogenase (short-subunit alcohol dehydrogenase family) [Agromyces terreus]|uniref:NAD(P)-dependent dehydrogenase (Short-subunit alcohol dehydrogenase family) n=1 Tax=Agromyces terreus TaxID=424795 RepID=A0A9X2H104_9MICO|nr:SDR family NAD(P)-dependent oxidoreductase [Agromyces terreus]MCP2371221.1 NAD(P)-dependent dehydrogenase (short-subunit alcohol dehydrogenase family) [Agromyces terreus]